jgi:adenylate cyclase
LPPTWRYSRLMGVDEGGILRKLRAIRDELADPTIPKHHGRLVKTTGDGLLVEFSSVVNALRSANEMQIGMAECDGPGSLDSFRGGIS